MNALLEKRLNLLYYHKTIDVKNRIILLVPTACITAISCSNKTSLSKGKETTVVSLKTTTVNTSNSKRLSQKRNSAQYTTLNSLDKNQIPGERSGYSLSYDENRKVTVLFGGLDSSGKKLDDTWEWSDGIWKRIDVTGPSARLNSTMAYDSEKKIVCLFGGFTISGYENDLWVYNGKSWSKRSILSPPPARQLATMCFDKRQSQLVIFGGKDTNRNSLGDTWVMKANQWTQLNSNGPVARASHSMIYNDDAGTVFIYAGYGNSALNDLWELKDGIWNEVKTTKAPFRLHASMSYDQDKKRILLFGGFDKAGRTSELWEYSNQKWSIIQSLKDRIPNRRAEHESVFIPGKGLFIFGGVIGADPNTRNLGHDTWLYFNGSWKEINE